jgi:starch phosphorylase
MAVDLFDNKLGYDWRRRLTDTDFWRKVEGIPDHHFWSVHQALKSQMLHTLRHRITAQHLRNHGSEAHLERMLKYANALDPNTLIIGFARRFATYKRATLLFENMDWLRQIIKRRRPAGAVHLRRQGPPGRQARPGVDPPHPRDFPLARIRGQAAHGRRLRPGPRAAPGVGLRRLAEQPDLPAGSLRHLGHEGGDERRHQPLGHRRLVGRGLRRRQRLGHQAGAGVFDDARRNREDSQTLYELLQDQVIPMYYRRNELGISPTGCAWRSAPSPACCRASTRSAWSPSTSRKFYRPRLREWRRYAQKAASPAPSGWPIGRQGAQGLGRRLLRRVDDPVRRIGYGEEMSSRWRLNLNGLAPRRTCASKSSWAGPRSRARTAT